MSDWFGKLPITPLALGAAWLLLSNGPPEVRDRVHEFLSPQQIGYLTTALKWLFAFRTVTYANSTASELALNNFELPSTKGWNWPEEIAVVTGASSGFGKLFSLDLAKKGIKIAALDLNDPPPEIKNNPKITFFKCDVTNVQQVKDVAQKIKTTIGHPSILINNAGIANWPQTALDRTPEHLQKIVGVNLMSHYYMCHEFVEHMAAVKKGHIVTIASTASFISMPHMVDYCVTKAAVQAFHEGLVSELRSIYEAPEVKLTIVHPDWADTGIIAAHKERLQKAQESILDPQVVSDAVVKNVTTNRGGRILLGGRVKMAQRYRFLPDWLTWLVRQGIEKRQRQAIPPKQAKA